MANAQGGDLEEKQPDQFQKTSEETVKVAKLEKELEAKHKEVAIAQSSLDAVKLERDELKFQHTDLVVKAGSLLSDLNATRKARMEVQSQLWGAQAKQRDLEKSVADLNRRLEGAKKILADLKGKLEMAKKLLVEKDQAIVAEGAGLRQSGYDTQFDDRYEEARKEVLSALLRPSST